MIHQIEQVGGVLEMSRAPLEDGHRFFKLHPRLSNTLKTILKKYCANCIERLSAAKNSINNKSVFSFRDFVGNFRLLQLRRRRIG